MTITPREHRPRGRVSLGLARVVMLSMGLAAAGLVAGCAKPPTELLKKLKSALDGMELAKKCAPEAYRAAMKMYEEAAELDKKKAYKEATQAAEAAQKLAEKAKTEAEANKGKCEAIAAADKKDPGPAPTGSTTPIPTPEGDKTGGKNPTAADPGAIPDTPVLETVVIHFAFNQYDLGAEAVRKLTEFAKANKSRPSHLEVEGHCDVRGSVEYNLSLGEKRARAVRDFLASQGFAEKSLAVISYGSERPEAEGSSEEAHAKNRRAVVNRR
jgi:peptidoglycan-associated lipoprotein